MKIALFVPCYVDALYPDVAVASFKLLKAFGFQVEFPEKQTCCGQPMGNAGFQNKSKKLVDKYEKLFSGYDYVVSPSASCASYIRFFHPEIADHKCSAAEKTMDIIEFIHDIVKPTTLPQNVCFPHKVSLHNSCHGVRELGLSSPSEKNVPKFNKIKDLLSLVQGITIVEPERVDECCGFGGMFSIEEPDLSAKMGMDKLERHIKTGAEYITGPDSFCLMHMERLKTKDKKIKFIHAVQILANGL